MKSLRSKLITFLVFTIILIVFGVVYSRIFVQRVQARTFVDSVSSEVVQKIIAVGYDGYGYISNMRVADGQKINEGDILFEMIDSRNSDSQFIRAAAGGTIKEILLGQGSYLNPTSTVMEIQALESTVRSEFKLPPEEIGKINIGANVQTTLPDNKIISGKVIGIFPEYDQEENILKVDSSLNQSPETILQGIPLRTRIEVRDEFAEEVDKMVDSIPIAEVRTYLKS